MCMYMYINMYVYMYKMGLIMVVLLLLYSEACMTGATGRLTIMMKAEATEE